MIPLLVVLALIIGSIYLLVLPNWKSRIYEQLRDGQGALVEELSHSLVVFLVSSDYASIYETLDDRIETYDPWKYIELKDETGTRIYPLEGTAPQVDTGNRFQYLEIIDLTLNDQPVGTLAVFVDWENIWDKYASSLDRIMAAFFALFSILLLGTYLWQNRLIRTPISRLNLRVNSLAKGDLTSAIPEIQQNDEIGQLAHSFELMRQSLKSTQDDLLMAKGKAEQSSQAKSDFLAKMSHEIRTPMNGVIGMANTMDDSNFSDEQRFQLQLIKSSGDSLMLIINDILDLAKVEANQLTLEAIPFNLREVVDSARDLYLSDAKKKGIDITLRQGVELSDTWFIGDPLRITQVIQNLINNAIKFTERGAVTIDLLIDRNNDKTCSATVSVSDTGMGIKSEAINSLFEPFKQEDTSTTRSFGGTGLGLSICRQLADLMGGEISVTSDLGKGSTFSFSFIVEETTPPQEDKWDIEADESLCFSGSALVVDDVVMNQLVICNLLEEFGIETTVTSNGIGAVERFKSEQFDIIFMDCEMPEMDGFEATQIIRACEDDNRIPIIALTANAYEENRQKCLAAGMDDFLTKPIDLPKLMVVLKQRLPVK